MKQTMKMNPTSDEILRQMILSCFAASDRIGNDGLRVGVISGIIHLGGQTATLDERQYAAEIAASIPGVRGVVNRIESPGAPSPARMINLCLQEQEGNSHE